MQQGHRIIHWTKLHQNLLSFSALRWSETECKSDRENSRGNHIEEKRALSSALPPAGKPDRAKKLPALALKPGCEVQILVWATVSASVLFSFVNYGLQQGLPYRVAEKMPWVNTSEALRTVPCTVSCHHLLCPQPATLSLWPPRQLTPPASQLTAEPWERN